MILVIINNIYDLVLKKFSISQKLKVRSCYLVHINYWRKRFCSVFEIKIYKCRLSGFTFIPVLQKILQLISVIFYNKKAIFLLLLMSICKLYENLLSSYPKSINLMKTTRNGYFHPGIIINILNHINQNIIPSNAQIQQSLQAIVHPTLPKS